MTFLPIILVGLLALLVAGLLAVWVATLIWVYRDAERLRKPGLLVALVIGLVGWPWGLLVWLILRGDWERQATPAAAAPLRTTCPQCRQALSPGAAYGLCPACLLRQAAVESGAPGPLAFTPPGVAELAAQFPQLEILELLGRGGMGAVYKARQPGLDRCVALKVLPVTPDADPSFAERFQREARALAALSHPHIVAVYEFGQTPTLSYFLMEYVEGANLRQIQRAGRLSPREALAIVPQICDALQFAHDRGIVHRDIKPENILIDQQGRVKIADFGLAKLLRPTPGGIALTETRHVVGTPQYMAPEQVEHPQTVDHRADIYSLGVVFYEMLTGELPLGRFAPPSHKVQLDVRLDEIVLKTLEKEPALRYQQVSEVKTEVQTLAGTPAPTSPPTAPTPPPPPPSVPPAATPPPALPPPSPPPQRLRALHPPVAPQGEPKAVPGVLQSLLLLLGYWALALACGFGLGVVLAVLTAAGAPLSAPAMQQVTVWGTGIISLVIFAVLGALGLWWAKRPVPDVLPFRRFPLLLLLPLTLLAVGCSVVLSEFDNLIQFILPMPRFLQEELKAMVGSGLASFFTLVIVAPLTEELFFRGLVLDGFRRRYSAPTAIVASALIFSVFHLNPYQFPAAFVLGLALAWLRLRLGSLWPCIYLHAVANGMAFLAGTLGPRFPGGSWAAEGGPHFQPLWLDALGVGLLVAGAWLSWVMVTRFKRAAADLEPAVPMAPDSPAPPLAMAGGAEPPPTWAAPAATSAAPSAATAAAASAPGPVSSRPSNPTKERKMTDHPKLVGVLYVAKAIMSLLLAIGVLVVAVALGGAGGFTSWRGTDGTPVLVVGGILLVLSFVGAVCALPELIGGLGLIYRKSWARILVLIVSALNLLNLPLGTALAVYAFWALTRTEPKAVG